MKLSFLMVLALLVSCDDNVSTELVNKAIDKTKKELPADPEFSQDSIEAETDKEEEDVDITVYNFNKLTGDCENEIALIGYNEGVFGECGDLSEREVSDLDFSEGDYPGLNLKGTKISNSVIKFKKIADNEARVNEHTQFDLKKNPFTHLFDQHMNLVHREKNKVEKYKKRISKKVALINKLEERFDKVESDEKKKKIAERILKQKEKHSDLVKEANFAMKKFARHKNMAKESYVLALKEPEYMNPKVKNKKWISFDGKMAVNSLASNELMDGMDSFSVSLWFRTTLKQNDKRLVNLNGQGAYSSFLFTLKNDQVVFGYRNADKKYKTIGFKMNYLDNDWHNLVASYADGKFHYFVNGELVKTEESDFFGFGEGETNFGSYQSRSHFFTGDLDEVSIWSNALSEEDVKKIYNNGIPTKLHRHQNYEYLSKWWRMGDKKIKRNLAGEIEEEKK